MSGVISCNLNKHKFLQRSQGYKVFQAGTFFGPMAAHVKSVYPINICLPKGGRMLLYLIPYVSLPLNLPPFSCSQSIPSEICEIQHHFTSGIVDWIQLQATLWQRHFDTFETTDFPSRIWEDCALDGGRSCLHLRKYLSEIDTSKKMPELIRITQILWGAFPANTS